jgi:hypothetical protein
VRRLNSLHRRREVFPGHGVEAMYLRFHDASIPQLESGQYV